MKLKNLGKNTLEIVNISINGIWILVKGNEYFLSYESNPWFRNATVSQIHNVQLLHGFHLRWDDLDVDIELDSLIHPEKYPLIAK